MIRNKKILIISPEKWGPNHVSKHDYALHLSANNEVYFLNPALGASKIPLRSSAVEISSEAGLTILNYKNRLPRLDQLPTKVQKTTYRKQASDIHRKINIKQFDIVWSFDPYRFWNIRDFKAETYIYHAVDDHKAEHELELAKASDLVLAVSNFLLPRFEKHPNKHRIGHGIHPSSIVQLEQKLNSTIKIGWMGNLFSENIDLNLFIDIASAYTEKIELVLIGPKEKNNLGGSMTAEVEAKLDQLERLKNVTLKGALHQEELSNCLSQIDIHLNAYIDYRRNISPYKLLHYLSTGKVVVSSYLFDADIYPESAIAMVGADDDFKALLKSVISDLDHWNSPTNQEGRKQFVKMNHYDKKIEEIEKLIK